MVMIDSGGGVLFLGVLFCSLAGAFVKTAEFEMRGGVVGVCLDGFFEFIDGATVVVGVEGPHAIDEMRFFFFVLLTLAGWSAAAETRAEEKSEYAAEKPGRKLHDSQTKRMVGA